MKEKIREGIKANKYKRNDGREDERRNKSKDIIIGMMEEKMKEGIKTKKYIRNDGREDERRNRNKEIS